MYALWEGLASIALVGTALSLLVFGHVLFWRGRFALPLPYDLVDRLACADGVPIELRRVPVPVGVEHADLPPVLLVHGIAANHRNQDAHPDHSLARFLAATGRDVWLVTLRSAEPGVLPGHDVRFASMVKHDLPTAIGAVLARTGQPALDYVGFSMGGMLLYAALDRSVPRARFRRVVTVGSPGELRPKVPVPGLARSVPQWLVPRVPLRALARAFAFASEWFVTPWHAWVLNTRNVAPGITRLALVEVIEDVPAGLLFDFIGFACGDGVVRVDDESTLARLPDMDMPALFVAGTADAIAPPSEVRHAFDAWGARRPPVHKRFLVLGRDFGSDEDYGHGDLALGVRVATELFPPIARFLEGREPELRGAQYE
jgi:polyhydroxyalkanoate synthase